MGLKIEAECGIREIFKARCGIKIGRRDRNTLRFEGGIRDRTGIDGIIISVHIFIAAEWRNGMTKKKGRCGIGKVYFGPLANDA